MESNDGMAAQSVGERAEVDDGKEEPPPAWYKFEQKTAAESTVSSAPMSGQWADWSCRLSSMLMNLSPAADEWPVGVRKSEPLAPSRECLDVKYDATVKINKGLRQLSQTVQLLIADDKDLTVIKIYRKCRAKDCRYPERPSPDIHRGCERTASRSNRSCLRSKCSNGTGGHAVRKFPISTFSPRRCNCRTIDLLFS